LSVLLRGPRAVRDTRTVSSIITFFVAADHAEAAGTVESRRGADADSVTFGNFDVLATLDEWESILTNRDLDELIAADGSEVIAGGDDRPLVVAASGDLVTALAAADADALPAAAGRWVELRADEGETIDDELAAEIVVEVASLAVKAVRTRGALYCRIS
jgi:hypothetical protein